MRDLRILTVAASLLIASGLAFSQTAQPAPAAASGQTMPAATASAGPAFDVATIKPAAPLDMQKIAAAMQSGRMPVGPHVEADRAEYTYMSLKDLIALAYGLEPFQVSGPEWLGSTRFDIVAKIPDGTSHDDAPAMLKNLLQERFKLTAHREKQEHPVFGLVVAKGGPKLKEAAEEPKPLDLNAPLQPNQMRTDTIHGPAIVTPGSDGSVTVNMGTRGTIIQRMNPATRSWHIESANMTMGGFADMLTSVMQMGGQSNRQVVDMTGLTGHYQASVDISLESMMEMARSSGFDIPRNAPPPGAASDPSGSSTVFDSIQQFGLKLEPRKAQVDQLVVDSVQKTPTEN